MLYLSVCVCVRACVRACVRVVFILCVCVFMYITDDVPIPLSLMLISER